MTIDAGTITWLIVGALALGVLAVAIDRLNFPQKPFRPKRIETSDVGASRDRTGAHIVDEIEEEDPTPGLDDTRRKPNP